MVLRSTANQKGAGWSPHRAIYGAGIYLTVVHAMTAPRGSRPFLSRQMVFLIHHTVKQLHHLATGPFGLIHRLDNALEQCIVIQPVAL